MARHPRLRLAGIPLHVIQRGNNRSRCFHSDADRRRFLDYLGQQARRHSVSVHAYALMSNHVHLLMTPEQDDDAIGLVMKFLGQHYVQYFNRTYGRTGSLWEGRFRSCLVDRETYLLCCHRYIEMNPVRAGMVRQPDDYPWSSYRANAMGQPDPLLSIHPVVAALGRTPDERRAAYRELFQHALESTVIDEIRNATKGGRALGAPPFVTAMAREFGRPVTKVRRGPKPKG